MVDMRPCLHADIFCRVIDNYGDIGVCWRLARRLSADLGWNVRLWVDDLSSFARLASGINPLLACQALEAIEVRRWTDAFPPECTPGDMVIEAFACDPPAAFVAAMRAQPVPPVWINLEYLSAQAWVASFHGQPSWRSDGLRKTFFFPGFGADTGGLLREPGLLAARDVVQTDAASRAQTLRTLGLTHCATAVESADARLATLFCYPTVDFQALFNALVHSGPWTLAVAEGVAGHAQVLARECSQQAQAYASRPPNRPALIVERFAWLSQPDYDRLLWSADLNIVRGEDSFVRAQWAARPMLWHIYPQEAAEHLSKLDAWLTASACPLAAARAMQAFNRPTLSWSAALPEALSVPHWHLWQTQAVQWAAQLAELSDLADNLVAHYASVAKSR
jgi:uncharacterized repeat protein (TIGR03837 family)